MIAGLLLALVLAAFLFQWRTVLIALVTIPVVARRRGARAGRCWARRFNAISFAGLAVGARGGDRRRRRRRRERRPAAAAAPRGGQRRVDRRRSCSRPRTRCAARWRYATLIVAAGDRAGRGHGGPPRRVLRAARARLRAGGRRRDGGRADAHAGAQPAALLAGRARRRRVAASCGGSRPRYDGALSRFVRNPRDGADRRGRLRAGRAGRAPAAGHVGDPVVQGPRRARAPRQRARDVQPAHDADRHRRSAASCAASPASTTSAPTSAARSAADQVGTSTRARSG